MNNFSMQTGKGSPLPNSLGGKSLLQLAKSYAHTYRYDDLITKHALGENADFRHCLNPDCNSGHEHIPGPEQTRAALFIRNDCGYRSCATHNGPWHEGESCEEYGLRMDPAAQETASLAEIARVAKACPGNGTTPCGVFIIKNGGCAHMTCEICF